MPQRKKPFSVKQKKIQLQEKRQRQRTGSGNDNDTSGTDDGTTSSKILTKFSDSAGVCVSSPSTDNLKPSSITDKAGYDPNRYRLLFHSESEEEKKLLKARCFLPLKLVSEDSLETKLEDVYQPGTVLDLPKRPQWDYSMSKEDLERSEQEYFKSYVTKIFECHKGSADLSYFELNLETWRQLWRVLEMSDVFLVIVDLRFPVLHFPPTLYNHIAEELKKPMILVLNKVDLVPPPLAIAWKKYFESKFSGLHPVIFGSAPRAGVSDVEITFKTKKPTKRARKACYGADGIVQALKDMFAAKYDMKEFEERVLISARGDEPSKLDNEQDRDKDFSDRVLTIGCIGEPNVGKSSVINALVGEKVVSVSRTPGHTKHFQTIYIASNVRLCDCPGLVFPATAPKVLQIVGGIYPVSQVSNPYIVVGFLAERIPLIKLLKLKHPRVEGAKITDWSAMDVCEAWALKRGFLTAKAGRPDAYRAANHLLRVALEGRICLRLYPPGYCSNSKKSEFERVPETSDLIRKLKDLERQMKKPEDLEDEESDPKSSVSSDVDDERDSDGDDEESEQKGVGLVTNRFAVLDDEADD